MMASSLLLTDQIRKGRALSEEQAEAAVRAIMSGSVPAEEIREWLLALKAKGETLSEIVGSVRALRACAVPFPLGDSAAVDTCGTGGDGLKTINLSTLAALTAAAAGVPVVKHGNRAVSSASGSADLLEALGVGIDVDPEIMRRCFEKTGFAFLFAPRYHPAMKIVAPVRKELGVPTLFNLLGPLSNPAGVLYQVVGVSSPAKMDLYAQALQRLGTRRAWVVHGADGQDELSVSGYTEVIEVADGAQNRFQVDPSDYGFLVHSLRQIQGGSPLENAQIALRMIGGEPGAVRDAVLLNAGAALFVCGRAASLQQGIDQAAAAIDSGALSSLLETIKQVTHL